LVQRIGQHLRRRRRVVVLGALACALAGAGGGALWERRKVDRLAADGETALAAREYGRAREFFERYLTERPTDARVRLLAARAARQDRAYRVARDHLVRYRADGGSAEALELEDALLDVARGDARPVAALRERVKRDDDLALVALEGLIQHDLATYQLGAALDGFTRYLARRPDDLHARLGRAYVWERFMNFADALEDYRAAVAAHPDSARARLRLAETLLVVGTPGEAEEQFRWLAEREPTRPPVRLGLARCARRLGRPDEAAALLDKLLVEFPDHGETLWERGDLELERGNPTGAEPRLRAAAAQRPYDRRVQYALYRCLIRLDRAAEAEAVNARVKQLDADLVRLNEIRHEVMKRPNDAALRSEGGVLFLRNGERDEGLRWLRLALDTDPTCEPARAALINEGVLPPQQGSAKINRVRGGELP
jgi:tetratricopeptide (TPR) repeat protein